MKPKHTILALALAVVLATATAGCSSVELDSNGRWVGGGKTMTAWADAHVPSGWHRVRQSVTYGSIIDDFGNDTNRDETTYTSRYRDVTKEQFERFGRGQLDLDQVLECEPYDPATAADDEKRSVESCYLSVYQGGHPLPREFDLFAVWTSYPDGTTTIDLYLTNDGT